ncbi:hypothetical protein BKA56DRAFT_621345 [Ilyonectria sp. MPI-CAGE-AT-0026]|nr:hypothetical protein BKA56DRAFT_621345 [Ilyonectria sp. MPI-CAGE-AT-0026]
MTDNDGVARRYASNSRVSSGHQPYAASLIGRGRGREPDREPDREPGRARRGLCGSARSSYHSADVTEHGDFAPQPVVRESIVLQGVAGLPPSSGAPGIVSVGENAPIFEDPTPGFDVEGVEKIPEQKHHVQEDPVQRCPSPVIEPPPQVRLDANRNVVALATARQAAAAEQEAVSAEEQALVARQQAITARQQVLATTQQCLAAVEDAAVPVGDCEV